MGFNNIFYFGCYVYYFLSSFQSIFVLFLTSFYLHVLIMQRGHIVIFSYVDQCLIIFTLHITLVSLPHFYKKFLMYFIIFK
jgi:hypothetical protein